jgi:hypothetical protein
MQSLFLIVHQKVAVTSFLCESVAFSNRATINGYNNAQVANASVSRQTLFFVKSLEFPVYARGAEA